MFKKILFISIICALDVSAQTFNWSSIEPSANLSWVSCYSGFECTRFSVPLNYSDDQEGSAAIAMLRLRSNFTGSDYLGPIFYNPGGPGVSGVDDLVGGTGAFLAGITPQFDIVTFDPRGVDHSTPAVTFFESDAERQFWLSAKTFDANSSSDALAVQVAQSKVIGQLAKDRDNGILAHVATDNVARDLLQMVEAYGEENLQYWGISYGSLLGETFATLFPDRIDRMIIDGVLDGSGWFSNNLTDQVLDIGVVLQGFFDGCHSVGPTDCAFYASTSDEIAANLNSLYDSIRVQPLPAYAGPSAAYGTVNYDYLRNVVVRALYSPYSLFSPLASALSALSAGNATEIYELIQPIPNSELCQITDADLPSANQFESELAVQCADGGVVNDTLAQLFDFMVSVNSSFAGEVATFRSGCVGWQVHPEHFKGPVGANTSHPILLIGNTADPVTPLANAQKISADFPGSAVLTQDSFGHTSFAASSSCTAAFVLAYFVNGTLPEPGTVCSVETPLFPSVSSA
ncbi:TAP-like protein-domain-containing protein [Rhodocollybia butyracea]|uniref:TAP-like protein-domain-containing protein n=1 Tax=Rhodocollybia butyracea TaxID=206335 RepID=A0A9P5U8A5_9AGAR|nr:TAP-like protein-domain-containing protein [Rhodocollybia butyracea]